MKYLLSSGAVGGKTGKTAVLPGFCKIELGCWAPPVSKNYRHLWRPEFKTSFYMLGWSRIELSSRGSFNNYIDNMTHCVLLKHYYSVEFPWWFDRKISFFSKTCEMAKCKATLCDLTEKLFVSNFIRWPNLQIILEVKSMDESSWKKIYYISFYSSFCRKSPFHREWPQLVTILTSFDLPFEKKFKSWKY